MTKATAPTQTCDSSKDGFNGEGNIKSEKWQFLKCFESIESKSPEEALYIRR